MKVWCTLGGQRATLEEEGEGEAEGEEEQDILSLVVKVSCLRSYLKIIKLAWTTALLPTSTPSYDITAL